MAAKKKQTFEDRLAELEAVVSSLESGGSTLEESMRAYENGMKLIRSLEEELVQAEQKLDQAVDEGGQYAPLPAPAMADQNQREHADKRHAAAEGQIEFNHAQDCGDSDQDRAFGEFTGQVLFHLGYRPFFSFLPEKENPHARTHVEAVD